MRRIKDIIKKLNDTGSTLVTVIVVVTFVTIIATTILYLSGTNFMMKETNRKTAENFYDTETALEEIKTGLCAVAAEATKEAYFETMINYSITSPYTRYETFETVFLDELERVWNEKCTAVPGTPPDYETYLNSMLSPKYAGCLSFKDGCDGSLDMSEKDDGYAYIRGFIIEFQGADKYYTRIETDFVFTVPIMNWALEKSYSHIEDASGSESVDERKEYDIAEYVNYINWIKSSE